MTDRVPRYGHHKALRECWPEVNKSLSFLEHELQRLRNDPDEDYPGKHGKLNVAINKLNRFSREATEYRKHSGVDNFGLSLSLQMWGYKIFKFFRDQ